jgi:hypothetical protein
MTAAVARVPPQRARDASGIITTAIQVSYAAGLTVLGSLSLARAGLQVPHSSGHAFTTVAIVLAALALIGAALAAVATWETRSATPRHRPPPATLKEQ